ncbi:MAG: hypothetical protein ACYS32_04675 [Planctomycetota bacterium]|jgi:hypothetical protein
MEVQAVESYREPGYPTKREIKDDPRLLRKTMSQGRLKLLGAGLSGALMAALSVGGCEDTTVKDPGGGDIEVVVNDTDPVPTREVSSNKQTAMIAPLFAHGKGRGVTGCIVISPPVFISEEEAAVIIKEELAKHGVELDRTNVVLEGVEIKPDLDGAPDRWQPEPLKVEMDMQDSDKKISVEFVSQKDHSAIERLKYNRMMSTVHIYKIKKLGERLRRELRIQQAEGVYGIFYDPMVLLIRRPITSEDGKSVTEMYWKERMKLAKENASEELRKQVQDFAEWLKEKEVI